MSSVIDPRLTEPDHSSWQYSPTQQDGELRPVEERSKPRLYALISSSIQLCEYTSDEYTQNDSVPLQWPMSHQLSPVRATTNILRIYHSTHKRSLVAVITDGVSFVFHLHNRSCYLANYEKQYTLAMGRHITESHEKSDYYSDDMAHTDDRPRNEWKWSLRL